MSSPVFESFAQGETSGSSTDTTVSKPAGTVAGDLLICLHSANESTPQLLSGWTNIATSASDPGIAPSGSRASYRIADESEPASYTFTTLAGDQAVAAILRISGFDPSTPIDVFAVDDDPTVAPSVTTTVVDCLILYMLFNGQANVQATPNTFVYTKFKEFEEVTLFSQNLSRKNKAAAGSTGTAAWTILSAGQEGHSLTLAVHSPVVSLLQTIAPTGIVAVSAFGTATVTAASAPAQPTPPVPSQIIEHPRLMQIRGCCQ